jgi:hypothetical protein
MIRTLSTFFAFCLMAGAALAQERDWTLDTSEEDAYLIFGVPESEDVGVSLWCRIGQGVVNLYLPAPTRLMPKTRDGAAPIIMTAGTEQATFRGKADVNRDSTLSSIEAEMAVDHPMIAALKTADRFTIKADVTEVTFPLYNADLEGLLALCRKP